ncbi:uncharacterized protein SOCE26_064260 [Sorangium cellulosum]|uniref:Uncharacterized protein n=1 Tax=Sorangium cellulosum TaxID=56 RepID=A0A2L0F0A1_SORCE|nr:uncharacterized protein SOCE26_064260 [Sorangium cellulosum]
MIGTLVLTSSGVLALMVDSEHHPSAGDGVLWPKARCSVDRQDAKHAKHAGVRAAVERLRCLDHAPFRGEPLLCRGVVGRRQPSPGAPFTRRAAARLLPGAAR